MLAAVRKLNRLEAVGETLRAALNALASTAPEWLRVQITAEWFERYGRRIEEYRLPKGQATREEYAAQIGADGFKLLEAIEADTTPAELRELTAVKTLRLMWEHQYQRANGTVGWRAAADLPPAGVRFDSPYDPEAHFGNKRTTTWTGYKVHLTETCDVDEPHLITHVETTSAVIPDVAMTETIHQSLADKELLPHDHIVDSGYVGAEVLVTSQSEQGVTLIGPMRGNVQWQAQARQGYDLAPLRGGLGG